MDSLDSCFLAEELAVSIRRSLQDSRVGVGLPAWVGVGDFDSRTSELEDRSDHLRGTVTEARSRAALARLDEDDAVTLLDGGEVVGGLYEVFDFVAHTQHAVRASIERTHQSGLRLAVDDLGRSSSIFNREADVGVYCLELVAYCFIQGAEEFLSLCLVGRLNPDEGVCFARDGIVEVTTTDFSQTPFDVGLQSIEVASKELISVP